MSELEEQLRNALNARLHSRKITYDLFVFNDEASVDVHIKGNGIKLTIPFIINANNNEITVLYKDNVINVESIDKSVSTIVALFRRMETKISKY